MRPSKRRRPSPEKVYVKQESETDTEKKPTSTSPSSVPNRDNHHSCKVCSESFATLDELVMHAKIEHTPRKTRTFPVEDIEYFLRVFLKLKRSHCPICRRAILNTLNWRGHMYKHCVAREVACRVCGKRFTRADHCKSHEARHKVKAAEVDRDDVSD